MDQLNARRSQRDADDRQSASSHTTPDYQPRTPSPWQRWWRGLIRSFGFAFAGINWTIRTQRNAQIHVAVLVAVIIAGFALRVSAGEWLALILSMALVLALEAMNSAIEAVVNLVSPEYHPLARHAKDAAAGAVLLAAIGTAVVGLIVFVPKLFALL